MRIHHTFGIGALVAGALTLVACAQQVQQVETGAVDLTTRWSAVLTPPGDAGGIDTARVRSAQDGQVAGIRVGGSATLLPTDAAGNTRAIISVFGAKPGAALACHVHAGRCGDDRGVLGQASDYPAITVGPDGRGDAIATVTSVIPVTGEYFVNVHASKDELWTLACGNLTRR